MPGMPSGIVRHGEGMASDVVGGTRNTPSAGTVHCLTAVAPIARSSAVARTSSGDSPWKTWTVWSST